MSEYNNKLIFGVLAGAGIFAGLAISNRRKHAYSFNNKVVLITGGSRGLGLVLARALADEGARIAICSRNGDELTRARIDLEHRGGGVFGAVCDIRSQDDVERLVEEVRGRFGRIDVLINNAGIIQVAPLDVQTKRDFEDSLATHFWGPFHTMHAVLPEMKRRREGRIINISSIGGKIAVPHLAAYCAGKFALAGLSSAVGTELKKHNVFVTTIYPGLMRTGSHINAKFKGQNEKEFALFSLMNALPLFSINAERAALQIINASRRGDSEAVITVQANLGTKFNSLFPETTANLLSLIDRFLPSGDGNRESSTGLESASDISPSWMTSNIDAAATRNNELQPNEHIH